MIPLGILSELNKLCKISFCFKLRRNVSHPIAYICAGLPSDLLRGLFQDPLPQDPVWIYLGLLQETPWGFPEDFSRFIWTYKKIHQNMLRIPLDTFTMLLALGSTQDCFRMPSGLLQGIPRIHLGFPGQFIRFSLRFALCSLGFPQGALRNYCTLSSSWYACVPFGLLCDFLVDSIKLPLWFRSNLLEFPLRIPVGFPQDFEGLFGKPIGRN